MALTAGEMSVALENLGTTSESVALCCLKKPAHWATFCSSCWHGMHYTLGSDMLKVLCAPTSISLQHICHVVVSL